MCLLGAIEFSLWVGMVPGLAFKESNGLLGVDCEEAVILDPCSVHAGVDCHYR